MAVLSRILKYSRTDIVRSVFNLRDALPLDLICGFEATSNQDSCFGVQVS
jgi:hypothetical protein